MRDRVKQQLSSTTLGRRPSPAVLGLLVGLGIVTAMAAFAYRHMTSLDDRDVLDVQMPGMDGLSVLERLRQKDPGLPAVIMTGYMEIHAGIAEARARSGVTYVGKPIDVDELLRAIGRVCVRPDASTSLEPVI